MKRVLIGVLFVILLLSAVSILLIHKNTVSNNFELYKALFTGDPVIVAAGDITCDFSSQMKYECKQNETADLISSLKPDAVLPLGDLQYIDGSLERFQKYYHISWGRFKDKTFPVVGNHEYQTKNAAGYFNYFGKKAGGSEKGYYSYNIGSWHIIALNSNCWAVGGCSLNSPQGKWLKNDLLKNKSSCILSYWHHPFVSTGQEGSAPNMADIWQLLYSYHADVVLSSHDHLYERFGLINSKGELDQAGIREFVVGTGGRNLYSFVTNHPALEVKNNTTFGVLAIILHTNSFSWKFVPVAGSPFADSGQQSCHKK